jgi:hypothetical protein
MIKIVFNFLKSIYDVYLYKVVRYYEPIIDKYVYNNKIAKYNMFYQNNNEYIYKYLNVEYNNGKYFNLGTYYHTSIDDINIITDKELIYFEDDIDSIKIKLLSENNEEYTIIDKKFTNTILNFSTKQSRLEPLLYYYLQTILLNNDTIIDVEFEINNDYIKINIDSILDDLFN